MKIEDIRLGMSLVTTGGLHGQVVAIEKEGGLWLETEDRTRFPVHVECVKPARDDWIEYWFTFDLDRAPLAEVAKCYKQVGPEQLLLSEDAQVVCEFVRANGPMTSYEISERLHMMERCVLESLIDAREAGIIRLDDGKYSIVRESC